MKVIKIGIDPAGREMWFRRVTVTCPYCLTRFGDLDRADIIVHDRGTPVRAVVMNCPNRTCGKSIPFGPAGLNCRATTAEEAEDFDRD